MSMEVPQMAESARTETAGTGGRGRRTPPEPRADARRNRDLLLAEARKAFAEHGTDASLRDIARRAGVGIGTLYRHYPTRDALLEAVLRDGFDALRQAADELSTAPAPGD